MKAVLTLFPIYLPPATATATATATAIATATAPAQSNCEIEGYN